MCAYGILHQRAQSAFREVMKYSLRCFGEAIERPFCIVCSITDTGVSLCEYLHALRLASELADLRLANTNPIRALSSVRT